MKKLDVTPCWLMASDSWKSHFKGTQCKIIFVGGCHQTPLNGTAFGNHYLEPSPFSQTLYLPSSWLPCISCPWNWLTANKRTTEKETKPVPKLPLSIKWMYRISYSKKSNYGISWYLPVLDFGVWSELGPVPWELVFPWNHLQSNLSDLSCL